MTEVNMVREHLRHTNVVSYHKCFQEGGQAHTTHTTHTTHHTHTTGGHLYIVMQYLEGASLLEHITSLKEKGQKFTEERLWRVFTQLTLALRYIHKEKRIVHRDLSPANLMLGEGDKLTISEYNCSYMLATIGYCTPLVILPSPFQLTLVWLNRNRES